MSSIEIERLLHHWPAVITNAKSGWMEGFAKSIAKQSRRRTWRPSPKQLQLMRSMVTDLFLQGCEQEESDLVLIED